MGDFNADCSYLSQKRYNMLELVTDLRFTWLLDTDVDTTTKNSNCAYDRCVCGGVGVREGVWKGGWRGCRGGKGGGELGGSGLTIVDSICDLSTTLANTLTISSWLQPPTGLSLLAASVPTW